MKLIKAELRDFRNIKSASVKFGDGMNILFGRNGSGKTNLAEAVYFFAIAKSFRVSEEEKTVKEGEYAFSLRLHYSEGENAREIKKLHITVQNEGIKYIERDGVKLKPSELIGSFRAVLYTPDTPQKIIKGAPVEKRRFLDILLCQIDKTYLEKISLCNRIAKERVSVMKQRLDYAYKYYGGPSRLPMHSEELDRYDSLIAMYTEMISEPAGYVVYMRKKLLSMIEGYMNDFLAEVYGESIRAGVKYKPSLAYELSDGLALKDYAPLLKESLISSYKEDVLAGVNSYGPAKDNVVFEFNGKEVKDVASQGQTRMLGIALKYAEGMAQKLITGETPLFILDDVMSELDRTTQMKISEIFSKSQTIVTTADCGYYEEIRKKYGDHNSLVKLFSVSDGVIEEVWE